MDHFDIWLDDYFTVAEADKIYSIGCFSYSSSMRIGKQAIIEKLKELNLREDSIKEFVNGVFGTEIEYHI